MFRAGCGAHENPGLIPRDANNMSLAIDDEVMASITATVIDVAGGLTA